MISVKFIKQGKGINDLINGLKQWDKVTLPSNVNKLGLATQMFMQNFIESHKKRPSGATPVLSKSINLDLFGGKGFGVGKISLLPRYWASINFGSAHLIGKRVPTGAFVPGESKPNPASFRSGRWIPGAGNFSFISKKPIQAMNFVENTSHYLSAKIDDIVKGLRNL